MASPEPPPEPETAETVVIQNSSIGGSYILLKEYDKDIGFGLMLTVVGLKDNSRYWALFRPGLPSGVTAGQLKSAYFMLCKTEGEAGALEAVRIKERWGYGVGWDGFEETLDTESITTDIMEKDGWLQINITEFVRGWLAGESDNYGFVLRETAEGSESVYVSNRTEDGETAPRLVVTYDKDTGGERCGKYDFNAVEDGNCLSYALRDTDAIDFLDIYGNEDEIQEILDQGVQDAQNALLELTAQRVTDYVEENKESLAIASFRRIGSYDAPIDEARDYRIAMRVGFGNFLSEGELGEMGIPVDSDYHFWVQSSDGSWSQKFNYIPSSPVPGTSRDTDPGQYPWQMGTDWGTLASDYYDSDVVYFAAEKAAGDFTAHKGGLSQGGGEGLD
jgi:hypothetical protein